MRSLYLLLQTLLGLVISLSAFANDELPSQMRLGAEYAPLASAYDCVNLISGDFFLTDSSLVVDGPAPLRCSRFYDSGLRYFSTRGYGFGIDLPLRLGMYTGLPTIANVISHG